MAPAEHKDLTPTGAAPRKGRSGWVLRGVLLVSLALNLAVGGVVAGALLRGAEGGRPPRADKIGGVLSYALSPEDRREIGKDMFRRLHDARPDRADVRAEFRNILEALRAEPYDPTALEASLERQLNEASRRLEVGQQAMLDRIAGMERAERLRMADRLNEVLSRGPGREERRGDDWRGEDWRGEHRDGEGRPGWREGDPRETR